MLRFAFDIGGTFTDFVLEDQETGARRSCKILSTPRDPAGAVLEGLSRLLREAQVTAKGIRSVLHATTIATNAIIERKGSATALITTRGFRDVLLIGRQKRYDMFDLHLDKPKPLIRRRDIFEVPERVLADGSVEERPDPAAVDMLIREIAERGYESIAVSFLHSYIQPAHERLVGDVATRSGRKLSVTLSSDVSPKFREYERTSTTVANAYVKPIVQRYIGDLTRMLGDNGVDGDLLIMQSNGGLVTPELACDKPIHIVESGPAAGVLMCGSIGRQEGYRHVLTFDMGGTTAKLGAIDDGAPAILPTLEVDQLRYKPGSGLPLNVPAIELLEIGAGGGSIAHVDLGVIKIGPESAGAEPGPICYGKGGRRPTVTDANLVLGYLNPSYFNAGAMRLDRDAALAGITELIARPLGIDSSEAAWGIHAMANANMERAMRLVSVERGRDPRQYALIGFGGAGPLHAVRLAMALGIPEVVVPKGAGVGSALGLLDAESRLDYSLTRIVRLAPENWEAIVRIYQELEGRAAADIVRLANGREATFSRYAYMRYVGQGHEIRVDLPDLADDQSFFAMLQQRFANAYRRAYGYDDGGKNIEGVDWYLAATLPNPLSGNAKNASAASEARASSPLRGTRQAYFPEFGGYGECAVYDRYALVAGETITGPAIIEERESTTVLPPGNTAAVSAEGNLIVTLNGATDNV